MLRFLPLLQLFGEFEPFGFEIIAFSIDGGELFIELVETLALTAAALPLPDFAELLPVPAKPGVSAGNPLPFLIASTISR